MCQPFDSAHHFIDQISEAVFDAVDNGFFRTLISFTHAVRLTFSMSARKSESTGGDDFEIWLRCTTL